MSSVWISPPQGDINNQGQPWLHQDPVNLQLVVNTSNLESLDLIGGVLPPGLFYNPGTRRVQGTIGALPKDTTSYPVVFRAKLRDGGRFYDRSFNWVVDPRDETQNFGVSLATVDLGTVNRGSSVTIPLPISNPDQDPLVYKAVKAQGPLNSHSGLPAGLMIDQFGRIIGSPLISGNQPGDYWFRIFVRDPQDLLENPHGEGNPRTSEKLYKLTLGTEIVLDARLSDVVRWETPAGSLGSSYETFPSHFAVLASPQYEIASTSDEIQGIRYTLGTRSKPLPSGILLDPLTGLLLGRCPYVAVSKTFEFTIEARVVFINQSSGEIRPSAIASERTFSITVLSAFVADNVTSLQIALPAPARTKLARWIQGNEAESRGPLEANTLTILGSDKLFRPRDPLFGKIRNYKILLASGLDYKSDGTFISRLRDYHHPTDLRLGELRCAKTYSPDGQWIYDVLYITVRDPLSGAGGFDALGREEYLSRYQGTSRATAIPQWNLGAQDAHYFPNSIKNLRDDLILQSNRLPWVEGGETAAQRGLGVQGTEGLPLWMTCAQIPGDPKSILGYQCAVELAYLRPGRGAPALKSLVVAGFNDDLQGTRVVVDRYLLLSDGTTSTTFDGPQRGYQDILTLDGPDSLLSPTTQLTTLDTSLQSESKYYKFPPGDQ